MAQGLFMVYPRWESAIGIGKNGDHKDSTDKVEGASRELARSRFEHLQFLNRSICNVGSVRKKYLSLAGSYPKLNFHPLYAPESEFIRIDGMA